MSGTPAGQADELFSPQKIEAGSAGIPTWTTGTAYSVDQLVRVGLSVFICARAHTSSGRAFPGPGGEWQAVGAPPLAVYVDGYGADSTGATASDAAVAAAVRALGGAGGSLIFGPGVYRLVAPIPTLGPAQGIRGQGKGVTTLAFHGSGALVYARDPGAYSGPAAGGSPKVGGVFSGFTIDGANASGAASGLHYGDLLGGRIENVGIQNFSRPGCVGLHMDCVVTWCERTNVEVELINNAVGALFDSHIKGQKTYSDASYAYSVYQLTLTVNADQDGVVVQNGSTFVGTDVTVRGNFYTGPKNTGTAFTIGDDASGLVSRFSASRLDWQVETDGYTGVSHAALKLGARGQISDCYGVLNFLGGNGVPFGDASVPAGQFAFSGYTNVPGVVDASSGVAALSAGSARIRNASVTADTIVRLSRQRAGGTLGELSIVLNAGASFTITSSSGSETSTVFWEIVSY